MNIVDRIKILRKELNLTQTEFGDKIGVSRNTIAGYENGYRTPMDQTIKSICREFNVEHLWLTTGEGNMFADVNEDDEIIELMNKALSNENEFIRNVFISFAKLDMEDLEALENVMNNIDKNGINALGKLISNYSEITNKK